ncbi:FxSxx-COOH system tetratricopeptide repeat protein [Streptomyces goshikiensis]|uniref:FxSxx-COOH system tetratricopeptide repeat protein n=1 Tax=Streptomyces goshikiensis TaxID=1942 RepID=UPI002E0DB343|nr:FxSxx-COOH system tetratricopeptide repeat protein [Streptomyces goshikiensis]WSX97416.1 FxSxx-COOH system tetratricopeptide repeat protein [Streptomyces goshikiensis]
MDGSPRERAPDARAVADGPSADRPFTGGPLTDGPFTDGPAWQEIADAVWLAAARAAATPAPPPDPPGAEEPRAPQERRPRDEERAGAPQGADGTGATPPGAPGDGPTAEGASPPPLGPDPAHALAAMPPSGADEDAGEDATAAGTVVRDPAGAVVPLGRRRVRRPPPLRLAKALHRLSRSVPARDRLELDEERTARHGIADGLWIPYLRPAAEKAFDLVLLVDSAPTMRIWEDRVAAIAVEAARSGAFRDVRTVRLELPRYGTARLRWSGGRTGDPAEVLDARGTRIHLLVTDALAHGWAGPAADDLLTRLARGGPTALVHLLPTYLWHRSSAPPYRAELEAGGFGAPNTRIGHGPPPDEPWAEPPVKPGAGRGVPVPVLSLKPESFAAWADLVTGEPGLRRTLPYVLAGTLAEGQPTPGLRTPRTAGPGSADAAVRRFFSLATPTARRLTTHLAAVPFEFELIEELRGRALPEADQGHVAELLMGGLIDWGGPDGDRPPDFAEGVREALLATGTRSQLARTVNLFADLPSARDRGVRLRAALQDPEGAALPETTPANAPWVRVELAVLKALAGPYARRAARVAVAAGAGPGSGGGSGGSGYGAAFPLLGAGPTARGGTTPDVATPDVTTPGGSGFNKGQESSKWGISPAQTPPTWVLPNDDEPPGARVPTTTDNPSDPKADPPMEPKASPTTLFVRTGQPRVMGNVPPKNPNFTGRENLLAAVEEQLRSDETAAVLPHALHGMGGVGKSQLAIEYIYRHSHEYNVIWWIPAERENLILGALVDLARALDLDVGPQANTAVPAVREALRTGRPYENWLLVFDNAEDIETVRRYFPTGGPGKIIVTSRNRDWERVAAPLTVNVFERDESIALLQRRARDLSTEDADRLAEALGDLPLAIEQGGAWHAATGMPVSEYLQLLAERRPGILELDPAPDYPISVAAAWNISLDQLAASNPAARQLLEICACMAPEPIPLGILRGSRNVDITPELDPVLRDPVLLARATRDLSKLSLIKLDHKSGTLHIHRLMQAVLAAGLDEERSREMRRAAHVLLAAAKPGAPAAPDQWGAYQALLPHVMSSGAVRTSDPWGRELIVSMVLYLYYWGAHTAGAEVAREAWDAWRAESGEENAQVLQMGKHLAFLLLQTGEVAQALELNRTVLEISRREAVSEEELIGSMTQMAGALRYKGDFYAARELDEEADSRARDLFGPEDPATLLAAHGYGVTLRACGEFATARALDEETVRQWDTLYGPSNGLTLNTMNGLAIDIRESGDYPAARVLQEETYRLYRTVFGEDNAATVRAARNLAVCRRRDAALHEASELTEETLERFTLRYGEEYPDTLACAVNATVDRRLRGDFAASRDLGERTLRHYRSMLGHRHAYSLVTMTNLAATLRAIGDIDASEALDTEATDLFREVLGDLHPFTLTAVLGLANNHYARLDFDAARSLDDDTLPKLVRSCGSDHPLTLSCRANLALDLRGLGRIQEADQLNSEAVQGFARVLGPDHPWLVAARLHQRIECDIAPMPL